MEFRVTNGSAEKLTGLRVQMCVMLAGLTGFDERTNDNKVFAAAVRRVQGRDREAVGHHRLGAVRAGVGQPAVPVPARRPGGRGLPAGRDAGGPRLAVVLRGHRHRRRTEAADGGRVRVTVDSGRSIPWRRSTGSGSSATPAAATTATPSMSAFRKVDGRRDRGRRRRERGRPGEGPGAHRREDRLRRTTATCWRRRSSTSSAICPRWIDQHHDMLIAAAEAGCHVYMEKPFCRTLKECDAVVKALDMRHLKLGIAHVSQYSPVLATVREGHRRRGHRRPAGDPRPRQGGRPRRRRGPLGARVARLRADAEHRRRERHVLLRHGDAAGPAGGQGRTSARGRRASGCWRAITSRRATPSRRASPATSPAARAWPASPRGSPCRCSGRRASSNWRAATW